MQRIVKAAVLSAGVAMFFSPSFAQTATGTSGGATGSLPMPDRSTSPSGSMRSSAAVGWFPAAATAIRPAIGHTTQSDTMPRTQGGAAIPGSQTGGSTMGANTTGGTNTLGGTTPGVSRNTQGDMPGGAYVNRNKTRESTGAAPNMGDATERQITECLNNAAAQSQALDSCRR